MSKKLDIAIENAHESVLDCIQNESVHDAESAFMSYVLLVNFRNRFNLQEVEMAKMSRDFWENMRTNHKYD
jgi:hypothetical protein